MYSEPDTERTGLAIFASGSGSNAQKILEHFAGSNEVEIKLIVSNRSEAGVIARGHRFDVPVVVMSRSLFNSPEYLAALLATHDVTFIALAGFLWLIPGFLVDLYPGRIVNIHPALLPKFGGKGMYGMRVHEAVKTAGEAASGMTVHLVNERYDEGQILFQASTSLSSEDTAEQIAAKVSKLEHQHYPRVIEDLVVDWRAKRGL